MRKISYIIMFTILFSCKSENENISDKISENELLIINGDSLEDGFWKYTNKGEIYKSGTYTKGYKVNEWNYFDSNKTRFVIWKVFNKESVKFSYPNYLKVSDSVEFPTLFMGDIIDSNNNTYIALLEYNLTNMNSTIHDYLYQLNQSRGSSKNIEILKLKEVRKFYFKNVNVFKYYAEVEREKQAYNVVSYIFEVDGYLYDLTYKDIAGKMNAVMRYLVICYIVWNVKGLIYLRTIRDNTIKMKK
ncbi:MAG: hypothetical protein L3J08_09535 [Flavobacteriaceae bacterium]|nr:hypothetical protein [Flavobacteriaceae bacterium]